MSPTVDKRTEEERGQYLPEQVLPVDEQFTVNFKDNGGKFLYCDTFNDIKETFINILIENDWFETEALTHEQQFHTILKENNIVFNSITTPAFFIASCESLIADDGSILFCDKQIKDLKANDLPTNIIIFAKTSQITRSKSDGLREIKRKYGSPLPSNITAINCFKEAVNQDFLNYGRSPKNLYLLLLEDL
ncbi:MAG: LUD domain-containing protein [Flavobacteriaceae bacterium]|nr:LUD domain-containing protein [Flavobacteriaceae bacterium]